MYCKRITLNDKKELLEINDLYTSSFPENERKSLLFLLKENQSIGEIYYFYEDSFVGFACLLCSNDIYHIIYVSIIDALRDKGYGSRIVQTICKMKEGNRVIVDIEKEDINANNNQQRIKRKQFYLKNHFEETDVKYRWHYDNYEILSYGGNITHYEFNAFFDNIRNTDPDLLY